MACTPRRSAADSAPAIAVFFAEIEILLNMSVEKRIKERQIQDSNKALTAQRDSTADSASFRSKAFQDENEPFFNRNREEKVKFDKILPTQCHVEELRHRLSRTSTFCVLMAVACKQPSNLPIFALNKKVTSSNHVNTIDHRVCLILFA